MAEINNFQNQQIAEIKQHLEKMNYELGETQKCVAGVKRDLWWLKRLLFISLPLVISLLLIIINKQ